MKNSLPIEKTLRLKRQKPSLTRQTHPDLPSTPFRPSDPQFAAKDLLFELSSNDPTPQEENRPVPQLETLSINQWLQAPHSSLPCTPLSSSKHLTSQHRSVYISCNYQNKLGRQTSHEHRHNFSVIPNLKSHLRKLESPEKARPASAKRKEGREGTPIMSDQNFEFKLVRTDVLTPKYARRQKNPSLYKNLKKSSLIHNFIEGREWNMLPRDKTAQQEPRIAQKVQLIKQARRKRTLMNLLF